MGRPNGSDDTRIFSSRSAVTTASWARDTATLVTMDAVCPSSHRDSASATAASGTLTAITSPLRSPTSAARTAPPLAGTASDVRTTLVGRFGVLLVLRTEPSDAWHSDTRLSSRATATMASPGVDAASTATAHTGDVAASSTATMPPTTLRTHTHAHTHDHARMQQEVPPTQRESSHLPALETSHARTWRPAATAATEEPSPRKLRENVSACMHDA
jgi:hypothetical protein